MPEEANRFGIHSLDKLPTSHDRTSHDSLLGTRSQQGTNAAVLRSTARLINPGRSCFFALGPQHSQYYSSTRHEVRPACKRGSQIIKGSRERHDTLWPSGHLSWELPKPPGACRQGGQLAKLGCPCWRHLSGLLVSSNNALAAQGHRLQAQEQLINMAGKMPMTAGQGEMGLPNFDFSALQNVLNVSLSD